MVDGQLEIECGSCALDIWNVFSSGGSDLYRLVIGIAK